MTAISFLLVAATPGDAAYEILGPDAPPGSYEHLREALGLNEPLYERYWNWLGGALQGDLGTSLYTGETITHAIDQRVSVTASLIVLSLLMTLVVGVALGVFSAIRGGAIARFVDGAVLIAFSLPSYWIGAVLIALFAVRLGWLPAVGYVPLTESPTQWLQALILPVIALSLHGLAAIAKQTRESMLDVMGSEYIRMAWANGIPSASVVFRHAFKNACVPVVTILGVQAIGLLGGTIFVETVFALPGLGGLAVTSATRHDLPVVQGIILYFTLIIIGINLVIDLTYALLNPKVRAG